MAIEDTNTSPESYPMVAGDGPQSYAKNSTFQKGFVEATKGMVAASIVEKLDLRSMGIDTSRTLQIADLGCSVGPNTFIAVQNMIDAVEQNYQAENQNPSTLEFQVLFNDHSNNDFNTLFKNLPPNRRYYAAGVPGSFHGRLFPKSSLHIVHVSSALHWLSKVPIEVTDSNSSAWNKGNVYCTGFVEEVDKAYAAQFNSDMESFLDARAQELVPGGLMLILIATLPDGIPLSKTIVGKHYDFLGSCLYELAKMGLLSEEKVDSFNFPVFFPFVGEFEKLIRRNGNFSIERMDMFTHPLIHKAQSAEYWVPLFRASFEGLFLKHFGEQVVDQIFNHYSKKLEQNISFALNGITHEEIELFIVLKRN
ncbi:S-adenosylmethionine-dependent methyltransferase [Melia azedarach]|uniref:S-adenosylmethionine-dependent methyltransferase n=1 Tax=Melia azedarach TaxID=155640 RepID=A0ACC1X7T0_MELAZ|nr:S-adenosylmethionine-dependent methyltransferase [Melia azedarach]